MPDLFFYPRQELSEDERDDSDDDDDENMSENSISTKINKKENNDNESEEAIESNLEGEDECYRQFFGNNHCYLFLRLHNILCERLSKMYDQAMAIADEEAKYRKVRKKSVALTLRLKSKCKFHLIYFPYPTSL